MTFLFSFIDVLFDIMFQTADLTNVIDVYSYTTLGCRQDQTVVSDTVCTARQWQIRPFNSRSEHSDHRALSTDLVFF